VEKNETCKSKVLEFLEYWMMDRIPKSSNSKMERVYIFKART
jgi:hypothetical protein